MAYRIHLRDDLSIDDLEGLEETLIVFPGYLHGHLDIRFQPGTFQLLA